MKLGERIKALFRRRQLSEGELAARAEADRERAQARQEAER
jgi:hypothetical protein